MSHYLYMVTISDGRAYIGVSKRPRERFRCHCNAKSEIGEAIRQYGKNNAILRVLVCGTKAYIYDLEFAAVQAFGTRWPGGFNVASGGHGGRDQLLRHRALIGAAHKGKTLSLEHRAKLSDAKKRPDAIARLVARNKQGPSEATRIKLIKSHIGKRHADETRAKMSASQRGQPHHVSAEGKARIIAANKRRTGTRRG